MLLLIVKRLFAMVIILLALSAIMFGLQRISNTNPIRAMLGANASKTAVLAEEHKLGLNKPLPVQYFNYVDNVIHGNLGISYRTRRPVAKDIMDFLPATMELTFYALIISVVLGTALGVISATEQKGAWLLRFFMFSGSSAPVFLLAILGLILFYRDLGWLPATGRLGAINSASGYRGFLTLDAIVHGRFHILLGALRHLILPASCIALGPAVSIGRVLRASLVQSLRSDYILTARAKGLSEMAVVFKHGLRNSLGPMLSMIGLQAGLMLTGVVVVEEIFSWPGIGSYIGQSIPVGDFPAISGVVLVLGVIYVVINAVVDIVQTVVDPRIKS